MTPPLPVFPRSGNNIQVLKLFDHQVRKNAQSDSEQEDSNPQKGGSPLFLMDAYLRETYTQSLPLQEAPDPLLENLIHGKSRIAASKLEILSKAMAVRVEIFGHSLRAIGADRQSAEAMLDAITHQTRYLGREQRDKTFFYQTLFALEQEERSQARDCWRDIVMLLRDFLEAWESNQQAQARAVLLKNAGR